LKQALSRSRAMPRRYRDSDSEGGHDGKPKEAGGYEEGKQSSSLARRRPARFVAVNSGSPGIINERYFEEFPPMLKIKIVKKGSTTTKPGSVCPFVVDCPPETPRS
jgi:hypothetical protein